MKYIEKRIVIDIYILWSKAELKGKKSKKVKKKKQKRKNSICVID